jgi:hypothetical protein
MANYIVEVAFQPIDGLPKDQMVNVWHFSTAGAKNGPVDGPLILAKLANFYGGKSGTSQSAITYYYSPMLSEASTVKVYAEEDTPPRVIAYQGTIGITPHSTQGLPEEVALCLSYDTGRNIKGHRGRLYLGPFGSNAAGAGDPGNTPAASRPATALMTAMVQNAEQLVSDSSTGPVWCLRTSKPTVAYTPIVEGWVDNEWDSQRRRRIEATSRMSFSGTTSG